VKIVATHRRLEAVTNLVEIKTRTNILLNFTYGTVSLTNLSDDIVVKVGNEELPLHPALRQAYDRPGRKPTICTKAAGKWIR